MKDIFKVSPHFLAGMASIFNIWGSAPRNLYPEDPDEADARAMRSDWEAVGKDMENAINKVKSEEGLK